MIFHPCKYWLVHWKFPWLKDLSAQLIGRYVSALPLWMDTKDIICCTWRVIHWQSFAIKVTRLIIPSLLFPVGGFFCLLFPVSLVPLLSAVLVNVYSLLSLLLARLYSAQTTLLQWQATSSTQALTSAVLRELLPVMMPPPKTRGFWRKRIKGSYNSSISLDIKIHWDILYMSFYSKE